MAGPDGSFGCINNRVSGGDDKVYLDTVIKQPGALESEVWSPDWAESEHVAIKRCACLQVLRNTGDVVDRLNGQGFVHKQRCVHIKTRGEFLLSQVGVRWWCCRGLALTRWPAPFG